MKLAEAQKLIDEGTLVQVGQVMTVNREQIKGKPQANGSQRNWIKFSYGLVVGNRLREVSRMVEVNGTVPVPEFERGQTVAIRISRYERGQDGAGDTYDGRLELIEPEGNGKPTAKP